MTPSSVMFSVTTSFLMRAASVACCVFFIHDDRDQRATIAHPAAASSRRAGIAALTG
jgi:hypothetical protein